MLGKYNFLEKQTNNNEVCASNFLEDYILNFVKLITYATLRVKI